MEASRWQKEGRVAVVTGGSKGIGLEVCKQLAEKGLNVILTARDEERGLASTKALNDEQGLHNIVFHQLDVEDEQSIASFASWVSKEHGGLDILINNAAVGGVVLDLEYFKVHDIDMVDSMFKTENPEGYIIDYDSAKSCLDANYYGAKRVTKALIPLLRPSSEMARIVNVGSNFGQLNQLQSEKLRQELADVNNLSEEYIDDLLDKYLDDVKSKSLEGKAWPPKFPNYKMSKVALHAYTRILARDLEKRSPSQKIFVNCVHPGFVKTTLTALQGELTPSEGAENVVRVALFPHQDCPSGQFFFKNTLSTF